MTSSPEFSRFVRDLAFSLHAHNILYVGCSNPDDLSEFRPDSGICGTCRSAQDLAALAERYPLFEFRQDGPVPIPYPDNSFAMVFSHGLLGHAGNSSILDEMYRVSSKYIASFEVLPERDYDPDVPRDHGVYRYWLDRDVTIISNVQMHPDIDVDRSQFVLVKKQNLPA